MKHESVRALQQALNQGGATPSLAEDGIFGINTALAYAAHLARGGVAPDCTEAARKDVRVHLPLWSEVEAAYGPPESEVVDLLTPRGSCGLRSGSTWSTNLRLLTLPGGHRVTLHRLAVPYAVVAFADVVALKHGYSLDRAEAYCMRRILWTPGRALSNHGRGIAIDINADTNRYGTAGDLPDEIGRCLTAWGWSWGRDWRPESQRDPMHFELCRR